MIVTESVDINGKAFIKNYSDSGFKVEREGIYYDEAIDPAEFGRQYTETDKPIEDYSDEATEADYQAELRRMGVNV